MSCAGFYEGIGDLMTRLFLDVGPTPGQTVEAVQDPALPSDRIVCFEPARAVRSSPRFFDPRQDLSDPGGDLPATAGRDVGEIVEVLVVQGRELG